MKKNNIFTEEGQTRFRNTLRQLRFFFLIMVPLSLASAYGIHRFWVTPNLTPLQRIYLRQYVYSTFKSYLPRSQSRYTYLVIIVTDPKTKRDVEIGVRDEHVKPDLDEEGHVRIDNKLPVFRLQAADSNVKKFFWTTQLIPDKNAYGWFREAIYEDQSIIDLWSPAWLGAIVIFLFGVVALTTLYQVFQHRYVKGERVRGTRELSPRQYRKEHRKHTGYAIRVYPQVMNLLARFQDYFGFNLRSYKLTVPREEENEGLLILGDPGTGKSQILHQLVDEVASREQFEAVVCYDPVGEFVEQHFNPETDITLNPLDARTWYWSPVLEIENVTDEISAPERLFIAESFFPDHAQARRLTSFLSRQHAASLPVCWPLLQQQNG